MYKREEMKKHEQILLDNLIKIKKTFSPYFDFFSKKRTVIQIAF